MLHTSTIQQCQLRGASGAMTRSLTFLDVFDELIDTETLTRLCAFYGPRPRGTPPKLSGPQLMSAMVFHILQEGGTLAQHSYELHGIPMTDSAHSQRRQVLHPQLFDMIMRNALKPLADKSRHKDCFYKGLRLVGVDGTQWSATNTPDIVDQLGKAASRRLKAAFAKVRLICAVELGTHAPVAAAAAPVSDGEQTVAMSIWRLLPDNSLVIVDRLFGTPTTLDEALTETEGRSIFFLARIRDNIKVAVQKRLPDHSALVDVPLKSRGKVIKTLTLREIHAEGVGADDKKFSLRLWTTLLDHKRCPASQLAEHYATRWENELYYRELKIDVNGDSVLAGHTVETAFQEIAALVLGSAVVARMRVDAADRLKMPVRRLSFYKVLLATRKLWAAFEMAGDPIPPGMEARFCKNYMDSVRRTALLPERRDRTCPRVVRQPVSGWPRKIAQPSYNRQVKVEVTRV
jgi:hypothetical protein